MNTITLDNYEALTLVWSKKRKIIQNGVLAKQALKLVSEVGELADNVAKDRDIRDDLGDCLVVLTNLAAMTGTTLNECWSIAYNDIKDRKGTTTKEGIFIKESDKEK